MGSGADDNLYGEIGNDTLCGGEGHDYISGNKQADILGGSLGNDTLYGGGENDTLLGGKGNDLLSGDLGNDSSIGGSGNDIFILKSGQGFDTIVDFMPEQDLIGLAGGLNFDRLEIIQSSQGILLKNRLTGESLGTIVGMNRDTIAPANFLLV